MLVDAHVKEECCCQDSAAISVGVVILIAMYLVATKNLVNKLIDAISSSLHAGIDPHM